MNKQSNWLAISYDLPNDPSKLRVYVWRKLKELGVAYLNQGVALLPNDEESIDKFTNISEKIKTMGGKSTLFEISFLSESDDKFMRDFFLTQTEREYRALILDCKAVVKDLKKMANPMGDIFVQRIKGMMKEYKRVKERNHLNNAPASELEVGFLEISEALKSSAGDFSVQIKKMFDKV